MKQTRMIVKVFDHGVEVESFTATAMKSFVGFYKFTLEDGKHITVSAGFLVIMREIGQ